MLLALTLACAQPEESDPLAADASRTGLDGDDGPYGVHLRSADGAADPPTDWFTPTDEAGAPAEVGSAAATLVLLQGGGVPPERYHWLAVHLASRGATVLVPHHGLDLAAFDATAGERALRAARAEGLVGDAPVGVLGHSLGGVMAAGWWAADPDEADAGPEAVAGLALLASYPAEDASVESRSWGSMVSLVGAGDARSEPADVEAGAERFNIEHAVVTVPDMNHYDWTDAASEGELASDGPPSADLAAARRTARWAIAGWVDSCLTSTVGTWAHFLAAHGDATVGNPCELMVMGE